MFSKTLLALSAATVLASTSGAFAQYTGYANQYVVEELGRAQVQPAAKFAGNKAMKRQAHTFNQIAVPESRIGDKYPSLEGKQVAAIGHSMIVAYEVPEGLSDRYPARLHIAAPVRATNAGHKMTNVRQVTTTIEVPENRIGDRYPFLASKLSTKNRV